MGEEAEYLNATIGVDYEFSKYLRDKKKSKIKHVIIDDRYVRGIPDCHDCTKDCLKVSKWKEN